MSIDLVAPGKVNLGLRVVGRRDDGYHLIESLFLPLELADAIRLEVAPGSQPRVSLELEGCAPGVPGGSENLAVRAAQAFLGASGLALDVSIRLRKSVPAGAGLGGGSSDAGTVLRGLARIAPGVVSDLPGLALGVGADVPFFLAPQPAWVSGIGEEIDPIPDIPALWLLLAHPGPQLSSARVYRAYDEAGLALTPESYASTMALRSRLRAGPVSLDLLAKLTENDLEAVAASLCPAIRPLRAALGRAGAVSVGMSGSGPTVFGVFRSEEAATHAARCVEDDEVRWWRTRTIASG